MENIFESKKENVFSENGCRCGKIHKVDFQVDIDVDLAQVCREIIPNGGRVFVLIGDNVRHSFSDKIHQSLSDACFDVVRFESVTCSAQTFSLPEGCNLILGIGDSELIARCKLLSASFDVEVVVVPTRFDIAKIGTNISELDYGGVIVSRPSRVPSRVVLLSELYSGLSEDEFADIFGEFFSFALTFCDYAYRSKKRGEYCAEIINDALSTYNEILQNLPNRSVKRVKELLPKVVRVNKLLSVTGTDNGAEQLSSCIARYLKQRGRKVSPKGERLIMSAYLLSVTYANFLSEKRNYFLPDVNAELDRAKRLFGMSENETVCIGKKLCDTSFGFDDYIVDVHTKELQTFAVEIGMIVSKSFAVYRNLRADSGYEIKDRMSVNETLDLISGSAFCNRSETLFSFIKERGFLEFRKVKI